MKGVSIERITNVWMAREAFHRYSVKRENGGRFLGEVFQFRPSSDEAVRWMAQGRNGTLYGWLTRLNSRKAAVAVLLSLDKPPVLRFEAP